MVHKGVIAMESINHLLLSYQIALKMYHFQTLRYGSHRAADKYLQRVRAHYDQLMEVLQGRFGRLTNRTVNIGVRTANDASIIPLVNDFIRSIKKIDLGQAVQQILDDMILDAHQFIYLLRLK